MRLIDADALKEAVNKKKVVGRFNTIQLIDNAPTVELDESVIQAVLNKRCMAAVTNEYLVALHGNRPQGEWEDYSVNFYRCPECGYLLNKDCPCCQTKVILPNMRKEEVEE